MSLGSLVSFWLHPFRPRQHKRRPLRKPRLCVECLEERTVFDTGLGASLTPNASFVNNLYIDLLRRQPGPSEIAGWTSALDAGASRSQVVLGFLASTEFRGEVIQKDYLTFLHRKADGDGLAGWESGMANGLSAQRLLASILSSNEYVQDQGGTTTGWLTGLYGDLLGRAPDAGGLAGWTASLQSGTALYAVALGMVNSPELFGLQVTGAYQSMLGRSPDPAGFNYWVGSMQGGMSVEKMALGIDGSDEYFGKAAEIIATGSLPGPKVIPPFEFNNGAAGGGSGIIGFGGTGGLGLNPGAGLGGVGALKVGPNVDVNKEPLNQTETSITIDPSNPQRMFVASNENDVTFGMMGAFSTDGGLTWTSRVYGDGTDGILKAFSDPWVAFDEFGNLFFSYLGGDNMNILGIELSTDGGKTFKDLTQFPIFDHPELTTGDGMVWATWAETGGTSIIIHAAGAPVTGLGVVGSFTDLTVSGSDGENFGDIAIGPSGQVMVTFQSSAAGNAGPDKVLVSTDLNGLFGSFSTPVDAADINVGDARSIPASADRSITATLGLAYDRSNGPHRGRAYLVYTDADNTTTFDTGIFVRFSDDNGQTWSAPVQASDDTTQFSQFFGKIAVDQTTGALAVAWYDCRNDPGSGPGDTDGTPNDDVEVFATASLDGGATFLPNVQVAAGPSNAVTSNPNLSNDFGDYIGLAFDAGTFFPAWADNSKTLVGNPDPPNFDIAIAPVTVTTGPPVPPPAPPPPPSGGIILPDDQFELDETSDTAHDFGVLAAGTQTFNNLTINIHANGLPDYDWFKWTAAQSGTYTVTINYTPVTTGDLELRVYMRDGNNMLLQLGSSLNQNVTTQQVSVSVTNGEPLYAEIDGLNHIQANYTMTVSLM